MISEQDLVQQVANEENLDFRYARTLPSRISIMLAYQACSYELLAHAIKALEQNHDYLWKKYTCQTKLLFGLSRSLFDFDETGELVFKRALRELIAYRRNPRAYETKPSFIITLSPTEEKVVSYLEIFKHLPERNCAPFPPNGHSGKPKPS